ncbi:MAG TPA: glycosyltransferase, partial [Thermoanaerobaculia bacterium]|nr:glycosyltransferase [Thermoanaerobaculia bacterium]
MAIEPPTAFPPLPPEVRVVRLPADGAAAGAWPAASDLAALVITFEREEGLRELAASLAGQTVRPGVLLAVDNGRGEGTRPALAGLAARGCEVLLVVPPRNLGPAGATALAMGLLAGGDFPAAEWLTILNDDLVFNHPRVLEEMLAFARQAARDDPRVGAVGRVGHHFDRAWARLRRPPESSRPPLPPVLEVDYLTTGSARAAIGQPVPMLRLAAVRDVGPFWAELFIGMTEVEYGLRLRRGGWRLLANGTMWRQPRPASVPPDPPGSRIVRTPWRRYYSTRNLVVVARVYGRWWTP